MKTEDIYVKSEDFWQELAKLDGFMLNVTPGIVQTSNEHKAIIRNGKVVQKVFILKNPTPK